jgi:hypothetical protein
VQIAPVSEPQHESLTDLLCALHAHYHPAASVSRDVVRSHLRDHLLGAGSPLRLVVASRGDGAVVGFVAIALLYSLVADRLSYRLAGSNLARLAARERT